MSDHPSAEYVLKGLARKRVERAREAGSPISHSQALEQLSKEHGFANWNAFKAKLLQHTPEARSGDPLFEPLEIPFEFQRIGTDAATRRVQSAVSEIYDWARRLDTLAEHCKEQESYRALLPLFGNRRPYLFERNEGRWPGGKYCLVDRGYDEFDGFAFTKDELIELGIAHWMHSGYCEPSDHSFFPVMDDTFVKDPEYEGLRRLARLLVPVASRVSHDLEVAAA